MSAMIDREHGDSRDGRERQPCAVSREAFPNSRNRPNYQERRAYQIAEWIVESRIVSEKTNGRLQIDDQSAVETRINDGWPWIAEARRELKKSANRLAIPRSSSALCARPTELLATQEQLLTPRFAMHGCDAARQRTENRAKPGPQRVA